jgi:hypothetical protein
MPLLDPEPREAVENAEFFLTQTLVNVEFGKIRRQPTFGFDNLRRAQRTQIRRAQDDVRTISGRHGGEPPAERARLLFPERAEGHINIPSLDFDLGLARGMRRVTGDIPRTLAVADYPQPVWPPLHGMPSLGRWLERAQTAP